MSAQGRVPSPTSVRPTAGLDKTADIQWAAREDALTPGSIAHQPLPASPDLPRPSPNMFAYMTEPTSTAELLTGDLSRHSPLMAQYQRVTFQAA